MNQSRVSIQCFNSAIRQYTKKLGPMTNSSTTISSSGHNVGGAGADSHREVTGLSSRCVEPTTGPVGPGAKTDGDYKVPEYFCFNQYTFTEAEIELAKYRVPQPSALKK